MAKLLQQVFVRIALVVCYIHLVTGLQCYNSLCIGTPFDCLPDSPLLADCDMESFNKLAHHLPASVLRTMPNMSCLKFTTQDPDLELKTCGPARCPTAEDMSEGPVVFGSFTCDTCQTDGCNSTSNIEPSKLLLLLLTLCAVYRLLLVEGTAVCQY